MYSYHKGKAKKGGNEVCSFLYHYIQKHIPEHVNELHLFSDGCAGQNKNHIMIRFCLTLVSTG